MNITRSVIILAMMQVTACSTSLLKMDEWTSKNIQSTLNNDWEKFDKHVKYEKGMFSDKLQSVDWNFKITPPLPTNWPPQKIRSVTYYAYAEYQELLMHGPALTRSAPWAKLVLSEGQPASKTVLAKAIGPAVSGEGGGSLSHQQAERKIQIIKDGESNLPKFVRWTSIPNDDAEVTIIREYYCQWVITNRTADLIRVNHLAFFEWLACPPRTRVTFFLNPYPVLVLLSLPRLGRHASAKLKTSANAYSPGRDGAGAFQKV